MIKFCLNRFVVFKILHLALNYKNMQVRISDDYWSSLDAKLANVKKKEVSFFFVMVLIVISVFLYLGIVYFNQNEEELDTVPNKSVVNNPIISEI